MRVAWELGRLRRRLEADLATLLLNSEQHRVLPLRAGDPRVGAKARDKQLQQLLRDAGHEDEHGLIYGGVAQVAHRPFRTETLTALRKAQRALADAFMLARFSSELEYAAFNVTPHDPNEDRAQSTTDHQWHDAWLAATRRSYTKAAACEASRLDAHTYDERRRRRGTKTTEMLTWLREEAERERKAVDDGRTYVAYGSEIAVERGVAIPRAWRRPTYSRRIRDQLPSDCRFLDDERARWSTNVSSQPSRTRTAWRQLIELREERLALIVASMGISSLI